jgi:hypothetical protein
VRGEEIAGRTNVKQVFDMSAPMVVLLIIKRQQQ